MSLSIPYVALLWPGVKENAAAKPLLNALEPETLPTAYLPLPGGVPGRNFSLTHLCIDSLKGPQRFRSNQQISLLSKIIWNSLVIPPLCKGRVSGVEAFRGLTL